MPTPYFALSSSKRRQTVRFRPVRRKAVRLSPKACSLKRAA